MNTGIMSNYITHLHDLGQGLKENFPKAKTSGLRFEALVHEKSVKQIEEGPPRQREQLLALGQEKRWPERQPVCLEADSRGETCETRLLRWAEARPLDFVGEVRILVFRLKAAGSCWGSFTGE